VVCYEGYKQGVFRLSIVTLMSGGLDSCLMAVLTKEAGREQKPLFINYGQLNVEREFTSVTNNCRQFALPEPAIMDLSSYGKVISSGLTDSSLDIVTEAFLPGRNFLFLLAAASFAVQNNCSAVSIGLLSEETVIFPDQTDDFLMAAEYSISKALGEKVEVATPLREFHKKDVVELAKVKGISDSYSCHAGGDRPCGRCISCQEYNY